MASVCRIAAVSNLGLTRNSSSKKHIFLANHRPNKPKLQSQARISSKTSSNFPYLGLLKSVQLDVFITSDDEEEMSEGFFEAIEELERMAREPSDVLEEMNSRLSDRELQLVLVYFAQEGRDSWCAMEVFEWLKKENRVDEETMELMVSIMCTWVKKLIEERSKVEDVVGLLVDMDCVGLKTSFSMIEKVISLYWEAGEKEEAVMFVKEVLRRGISGLDGDKEGNKGGPAGYLAWKMMEEGSYKDAAELVIHLKANGLKPEIYSYLIAMTAIVKELNELAKALRKLKTSAKSGLVAELDAGDVLLVENYRKALLAFGLQLSNWALDECTSSLRGVVHERLLAMYVCAGRGPEAEKQLWQMKLAGKQADADLYDIVLAICASQNENGSVERLLARIDVAGSYRRRKTLTWLVRGYVKGGHFKNAAGTVVRMLDSGLRPELVDRAAVLHGLGRRIRERGDVDEYIALCRRLSEADLIGPTLVYLHVRKHKLWIIKMV